MDGASIIAHCLRQLGVDHMFGIIGIPVVPIAVMAQTVGINYIGMRNEQAASYAAGAAGYLTQKPGVCLAVSGPGMIHAIAGLANAWSNCWPMILIAGANDADQNGMGGFQEAPQLESARPYVKFAARVESIERVPFFIEKAYRSSIYGRPGACYLEFPGDVINATMEFNPESVLSCPPPPLIFPDPSSVNNALDLLRNAQRPLVIIGKGAGYSRAEDELLQFINSTSLPFLPTPMGKGVVSDLHPNCVSAARTEALAKADVILLVGARLNWILHFGLPPRYSPNCKFIQIDIASEEIGTNVRTKVGLVGDARAVIQQLNFQLKNNPWSFNLKSQWWVALHEKIEKNKKTTDTLMNDTQLPMSYYSALKVVKDLIPKDAILVSEGANTMDIARSVIPITLPRHRLDAGTFGTMGVGFGFCIAASLIQPTKKNNCN